MSKNHLPQIAWKIEKKYLKKGNDFICIFCGKEGSGKSSASFEMSDALDPNFSVSNVVFNSSQMREKADELDKGSALVIDEGSNIFSRLDTMSGETKTAVKKLTMMRMYNLLICLNISNIQDLHKYFIQHRMEAGGIALFRITKRGRFWAFFSKWGIPKLRRLLLSNETFEWRKVKDRAFAGSFPDYFSEHPEFAEKYMELKAENIAEPKEESTGSDLTMREHIEEIYRKNPDASPKKVAKILETSAGYVRNVRSDMK